MWKSDIERPVLRRLEILFCRSRLPNPDSLELHYDDEMAGSLGRHVEGQREDTGVHFEAGASGVLVEPQSSSREAVNWDRT
ncbi:uncharacterized protein N7525_010092 [Penicillium rubens]|uniref:uncharacterized protein n=1 Tax=Penicillium rubens TaxID=1108849 RepID=UPI002A5A8314|nr:uncharacterized protein N7525_010092 [Penicillium rubens]KAJ5820808.1 hypothetical protein N7525_010092 [Penicillium rubens]